MTVTSTPDPDAFSALRVHDQALGERARLIQIAGEIDLASAPALKSALWGVLDNHPSSDFVLELSQLTYLDSTGLAVLIGARRRLCSGQLLVIAAAPDHVGRLLKLTGLDTAFDTVGSISEAQVYLAAARRARPPALSPDAALVLGLAGTALSFAPSFTAEAECWTRILLPYATPGLDAQSPSIPPSVSGQAQVTPDQPADPSRADRADRLERVIAQATRLAAARGARAVRTGDVLRAVSDVYGLPLARALHACQCPPAADPHDLPAGPDQAPHPVNDPALPG